MRTIVLNEFGDATKLICEDTKIPSPNFGEVLVKVAAIGVNFIDIYQRKGIYPNPLPIILGLEFSGSVDAVGENVKGFELGDRVATANGKGGYAEYALSPASKLIHLPPTISYVQGAAILLQGMTAHYLAVSTFPLSSDHTALIHAAAGGVGHLLVQIAKKRGARVIGTVSTSEKEKIAEKLGVDSAIGYLEHDFESEVMKITDGAGVDVVYDGVGRNTFLKGLNCLKPRGCMVLYGQASGPVEPFDPQILNRKGSLYLTRPSLNHYSLTQAEIEQRAFDLFKWLESGELLLQIDQQYKLEDANLAHQYIEDRNTKGKVLLIP